LPQFVLHKISPFLNEDTLTNVDKYLINNRPHNLACVYKKNMYIASSNIYRQLKMARITVEDCIDKVKNRFELVAFAAQRAKSIASGIVITVDRKDDKDTVVALREIAEELISTEHLMEEIILSHQKMRIPQSQEEETAAEEEIEEDTFAMPTTMESKENSNK